MGPVPLLLFLSGVRKVSARDERELKKSRGFAAQIIPSPKDFPPFSALENALVPILQLRARYSLEIRHSSEGYRFLLWSDKEPALRLFADGLLSVFRSAVFSKAEDIPPLARAGEYAAGAELRPAALQESRGVFQEPLSAFYETASRLVGRASLQIVFAPDRSGTRFHLLLRAAAVSQSPKVALELLRATTSALQAAGRFEVKYGWIPLLRTSPALLGRMNRKALPLLPPAPLVTPGQAAALAHLPVGIRVRAEYARPTPVPPLKLKPGEVEIGRVLYKGALMDRVRLSLADLTRHEYVIGATGTGKSTHLINLALQTFRQGICTWILDITGDLSLDILASLSDQERERAVLLDPLRVAFAINPLEVPPAPTPEERDLARERTIGELAEMFKRLYGAEFWGPSLARLFLNSARLLYAENENPTLEEMLKLVSGQLEGASYREFYNEMKRLPIERLDAIRNKLEPFVKSDLLWRIFSQPKSSVDYPDLLKPGRLVLWRVSKGELSEFFASLVGSAVLTKLWFNLASRRDRTPVLLVLDEFQSFAQLETLGQVLTEGRKYGVSAVVAHQNLKQLPERLLHEVLANTGTKVVFRVGGMDSYLLSRALAMDELRDILPQLPDGEAVVKMRAAFGEEPVQPFQIRALEPPEKRALDLVPIVERMRARYGVRVERKAEIPPSVLMFLRAVYELETGGAEPIQTTLLEALRKRGIASTGTELLRLADRAETLGLIARHAVKVPKGRPRVVTHLSETGKGAVLAEEVERYAREPGGESGAKAGGELHQVMVRGVERWLRNRGYGVKVPAQAGRAEQPDLIAFEPTPGGKWKPTAYEVEATAANPGQVEKNYRKNASRGLDVVFVVPDEAVGRRVKGVLGRIGGRARVWVFRGSGA